MKKYWYVLLFPLALVLGWFVGGMVFSKSSHDYMRHDPVAVIPMNGMGWDIWEDTERGVICYRHNNRVISCLYKKDKPKS